MPFLVRIVPAAAVTYALLVVSWPALSVLGGLPGLVVAGALASVVYVALLIVLRVSEVQSAIVVVRQRLSA